MDGTSRYAPKAFLKAAVGALLAAHLTRSLKQFPTLASAIILYERQKIIDKSTAGIQP
jgi:hypothetical protein